MPQITAPLPPERPGAKEGRASAPSRQNLSLYPLLGIFFGIILIKSEVVSWFRIQEMFRFRSLHLYGIIVALVSALAGTWVYGYLRYLRPYLPH